MFGWKNVSKKMTQKTKIQQIKLFIKISIVVCVLFVFIVLGFFVKPMRTFESSNMKKWVILSEQEKITTLQHIMPNVENQELLISCINKISSLPNSDDMIVRDAAALCYNGIKLNSNISNEEK